MQDGGSETTLTKPCGERNRSWLWLALALLVTAGVFLPHLDGEFLRNWDDGIFILENRRLEFSAENVWRYASRSYRQLYTPLPMYSLMADKALFGLRPWAFRLHNLVLHCVGTALLYLIFRRFKFPPAVACLSVLLWSVHPQRNESVLWIVERKDVLCGVLVFGAFLAFLSALEEKGFRFSLLCGFLTILSLGCKPAAAPLAGVFAVYALMTGRWRWRLLIPVLSGVFATLLAALLTAHNNPGAFQSRWLVPLHNLFWYPLTAVFPIFNASPIYPQVEGWRSHLLLFAVGCILLAGIVFYALRVRRVPFRIFLGTLLILGGMLLPALGLWQYTEFHYCDRYNYLVAPVVLASLVTLLPRHGAVPWCLGALALLMAVITWRDGCVWRSDRALWHRCLASSPVNPKSFQVASGDALMRDDAGDLEYIAIRLREERASLPLDGERFDALLRQRCAASAYRDGVQPETMPEGYSSRWQVNW